VSHLVFTSQPFRILSARSGLEMYNLPKLMASQEPSFILASPVSGVNESLPMIIPEKKGRRALQTSGICYF